MADYIVHTDGGARGNPGPAAIGVVIDWPNGTQERKHRVIGETTNNQAEYRALLWALHLVAEHVSADDEVTCYLDSELVVKQMKGEYKVKDQGLAVLHNQAQQEIQSLKAKFIFQHVRRAENALADAEVNAALDGK